MDCSDLKGAIACIKKQGSEYDKTALRYIDESSGWGYGFTVLAAGAVGFAAFDASIAALKVIGLAAGSATALNADRQPTAMGTLYTQAAKTMSCMADAGSPMLNKQTIQITQTDLTNGDKAMQAAEIFAGNGSNAKDPNLGNLNTAITAYVAARQVEVGARVVLDNPAEFMNARASDARLRLLTKLNGAPTSVSDQQKIIQGYIDSATAKSAANGAQNTAGPTPAPGANLHNSQPPAAVQLTANLKAATQMLMDDLKPFTDAQANVPACLTNIPS